MSFCFSWLYRQRPLVGHNPFKIYTRNPFLNSKELIHVPNQLRWNPFDLPSQNEPRDFVDGMVLIASSGSPVSRNGLNILIYSFNTSMENRAFYNSDGDFLIGKTKRAFLFEYLFVCLFLPSF